VARDLGSRAFVFPPITWSSKTMRLTPFVLVAVAAASSLVACQKKEAPTTTTSAAASVATAAVSAVATTAPSAVAAASAAVAAPSPASLGLKPGEEAAASCDTISTDGMCGDALVTSAAGKADVTKAMKMICTKGTIATACPTADIVGSCRVGKDMLDHYYGHGGKTYDAAKAKAACEKEHGHFVHLAGG
jgi:hypothetical protein